MLVFCLKQRFFVDMAYILISVIVDYKIMTFNVLTSYVI